MWWAGLRGELVACGAESADYACAAGEFADDEVALLGAVDRSERLGGVAMDGRLSELKQTSSAFPAEWQGRFEDGRYLYARFRWNLFRFGIGGTEDQSVERADNNGIELPDDSAWMETERMLELLSRFGILGPIAVAERTSSVPPQA